MNWKAEWPIFIKLALSIKGNNVNRPKLMFLTALSLLSLDALAEEPSKGERAMKSFAQFSGAKLLVYELKRDPKCQKKTFLDFEPESWLSALPGSVSQQEKAQLKEVAVKGFEVMFTTKAPN